MKRIRVVQLGLGSVGSPFLQQYLALPEPARAGLSFVAVADSTAVLFQENGLDAPSLAAALETKRARRPLSAQAASHPFSLLSELVTGDEPTIVVDLTASDTTLPVLCQAAENGCGLVLANKRPLCAAYSIWRTLNSMGRLRYEATVGAGLPVISTLHYLQGTGDRILRVEGALSGTLGYLFSRIEDGDSFSGALRLAHEQRYTEPDPRDDLGGMDVARKALILARTIGLTLELSDIAIQPLYPAEMTSLSVSDFLNQAMAMDDKYQQQRQEAQRQRQVLRYLAQVEPGRISIGLRSVPANSPFGSLHGPDNLVVIHSERYTSPMRIAGPGAGTQVTAAAVLDDLLKLATSMRATNLSGRYI